MNSRRVLLNAAAALAVAVGLATVQGAPATAIAGTGDGYEVDQGTGGSGPCDSIQGNGIPDCSGSSLPGDGTGIPCWDSTLPCEMGGGGGGGGTGGGAGTPAYTDHTCDYQLARVVASGGGYWWEARPGMTCPGAANRPEFPLPFAGDDLIRQSCGMVNGVGSYHYIAYRRETSTGKLAVRYALGWKGNYDGGQPDCVVHEALS